MKRLIVPRSQRTTYGTVCPSSVDRKSTRLNSSHRDLHSFPTRRSSDLVRLGRGREHGDAVDEAVDRAPFPAHHVRHGLPVERRSEEHTSELQSPRSTLFPYTTLFRSGPSRSWARAWRCCR